MTTEFDVSNFDALRISLANAEDVRSWSRGEVKKPETINYRTLKPEKDGLFCEKIFGPTKDWECACGKYKRVRFKGIVCERCGVEVTRSKVRRERMGHIELAAPVSHIWYFKGSPSRLGYLLDIAPKELEKVLYFASSIITSVDKEAREEDADELRDELAADLEELDAERDRLVEATRKLSVDYVPEDDDFVDDVDEDERMTAEEVDEEIADIYEEFNERKALRQDAFDAFMKIEPKQLVPDEALYREMRLNYRDYFTGGMGAESVRDLLDAMDLAATADELRDVIANGKGQKRAKAIKRLKVVDAFLKSENKPTDMILDVIPVIPPDLRPMVQLDGGRFATSDLNDLYRRVINRNNRLKRLLDLGAPEIIVNNEKRMLQEAVDSLFDNGRRGRPVTGPGNRPLKSLSDMLKGKQGRFRQNLLGKRVDYSGRSVIVVGPQLKLHQCGLPSQMALELFKPFVMKRLVELEYAANIKAAKRAVDRGASYVWDVLEEVITEHPVLLNRAPTLHRLGIQAFEPVLVEGKAIKLHPLVCTAFNADFDGDQMAVHVPLGAEAQAEARVLMLSANNIKSPAHGRPLTVPTQDMIIGLYYLTAARDGFEGEGRSFIDFDDAMNAYDARAELDLQAKIWVRLTKDTQVATAFGVFEEHKAGERIETTIGRITFNNNVTRQLSLLNYEMNKKEISRLVEDVCNRYELSSVPAILDGLKDAGFHYATRAGVTVSVYDATVPPNKAEILAAADEKVAAIDEDYEMGLMSPDERHKQVVDIWNAANEEVGEAMAENFDKFNPIYMMAFSGARGNIKQIRQLAGMRGLMSDPKGEIIDRPIKANFREGLSVLEYFISTHGARKGLADTALRTADSGYLTRRLVDVAQDVIIREIDCGTTDGVPYPLHNEKGDVDENLIGRCLLDDVAGVDGAVLLAAGEYMTSMDQLRAMDAGKIEELVIRTVMTCHAEHGVCQKCYGWDLATARPVNIGTAVGIIAAQSIGEPGTQLTMRTFHTGGVAGEDITHGLPRVQGCSRRASPRASPSSRRSPARAADLGRQAVQDHHDPRPAGQLPRVRRVGARPDAARRDGRLRSEGGPAAHQGLGEPARPAAPHRSQHDAALHRQPGPGRVRVPGRGHQRQAHRGHRAPDAAQGGRHGRRRVRLPAGSPGEPLRVRGCRQRAHRRRRGAARGPAAAAGHHEGVAGHGFVPVGRLVPGDHEGAHRRRHRGQDRPLGRPQGERHHRQADPGGHGSVALPRSGPHLQGSSGFAGGGRDAARLRAGGAARYRGAAAPAAGLVARRRRLPQHGHELRQLLQRPFAGPSRPAAVRRGRAPVHLRRPGRPQRWAQQVLRGGHRDGGRPRGPHRGGPAAHRGHRREGHRGAEGRPRRPRVDARDRGRPRGHERRHEPAARHGVLA